MTAAHAGKVAAALILDALFGEPPGAAHPTVWMGRATSVFERRALELQDPRARRLAGVALAFSLPALELQDPRALRLAGVALALSLPALVLLSTRAVIGLVPRRARWSLEVALISTTLAMRGLGEAAGAVERELRVGNLKRARTRVGDLVGRDTADLSAPEVARAAVESVAENTSDGVVGPMLYGLLFGAPGALAYRAVNTLDSMVGYRGSLYEELGWAPARLDDLANLAPSRVTALVAASLSGRPGATWKTALRFGPLTESPNAGWAEAAFAGALGLSLGGHNSYGGVIRVGPILGDGRRPDPEDIGRSVRLMRRCCGTVAVVAFLVGAIRHA